VGSLFAVQVRAALADMQRHGIRPAALLVDTLFTSDGVFADPAGFLVEAVEAVRAAGGLFIADEVQPGFGRTGTHMWGFQRHALVPDLVTMGKPMGNGHPLAGLTVRPEILERFGRNASYFNTFGGNPVSAAVGLAVLQVIEEEGLQENARQVGAQLKVGLEALAREHDCLGQVRGAGLFIGVDIVAARRRYADRRFWGP
jgi:4-aminobutyrate aminotransferase-like enzyme